MKTEPKQYIWMRRDGTPMIVTDADKQLIAKFLKKELDITSK
jgi:hypothetical protein